MLNVKEVYKDKLADQLPVKVLQFGEGNFLRAFADYMIDRINKNGDFGGSIVLVQPIKNMDLCDKINRQNSVYTVLMRGKENGEVKENAYVVTSVSECIDPYTNFDQFKTEAVNPKLQVIISNTTEAGIAFVDSDKLSDCPPSSFPGKMTVLLYERFKANLLNELLILPVELIDRNGDFLKKYVIQYARLWQLPDEFITYINEKVTFSNTLVDRIVTGYPKEEAQQIYETLGYEDNILVACEPFHSWVIEAPQRWDKVLPFGKAGLNVIWTDNVDLYKKRKVRILNGAHTVSVLAAYLAGYNLVSEMMNDEKFYKVLKYFLWEEVIPYIDLPYEELSDFALSVFERFSNPFIKHRLLDISLNSVSKFKARCLCSLMDYYKVKGRFPKVLCFGLAALICFYKGEFVDGRYMGTRNGERYEIKDDMTILIFFEKAWKQDNVVHEVLSNTSLWESDLSQLDGFESIITDFVKAIEEEGIKSVIANLV